MGPRPIISFRQVNKWFGSLHVLRDITLDIYEGEVVVLCLIILLWYHLSRDW